MDEGGGARLRLAPVHRGDEVGPHAGSGEVGGPDGGGAVSLHGLNPRGGEDDRSFVEFAGGGNPVCPKVGLGDPLILVGLVGLTPIQQT